MFNIKISTYPISIEENYSLIRSLKERGLTYINQTSTDPYDLHMEASEESFSLFTLIGTIVACYQYEFRNDEAHFLRGDFDFIINDVEYSFEKGMSAYECMQAAS